MDQDKLKRMQQAAQNVRIGASSLHPLSRLYSNSTARKSRNRTPSMNSANSVYRVSSLLPFSESRTAFPLQSSRFSAAQTCNASTYSQLRVARLLTKYLNTEAKARRAARRRKCTNPRAPMTRSCRPHSKNSTSSPSRRSRRSTCSRKTETSSTSLLRKVCFPPK
jgi:hypothetical protein